MKNGFILLIGLSLIVLFFSVSYAASDGTQSDRAAIMQISSKKCPPQWCKPEFQKIIAGYATVLFRCEKKNCENDTAYFKKVGKNWQLVDQGTGITPDDLREYGFPARVAEQLTR